MSFSNPLAKIKLRTSAWNIYWSKCSTRRVSSKNKEKNANRKNSVKKRDRTGKKKTVQRNRKQRWRDTNAVYVHVQTCPWPLHHSDTHFVISKQFFSALDAVWSWWSCIYNKFKTHLRKISLSAYFKAISHYFGFNGPTWVANQSN